MGILSSLVKLDKTEDFSAMYLLPVFSNILKICSKSFQTDIRMVHRILIAFGKSNQYYKSISNILMQINEGEQKVIFIKEGICKKIRL